MTAPIKNVLKYFSISFSTALKSGLHNSCFPVILTFFRTANTAPDECFFCYKDKIRFKNHGGKNQSELT